ncbi:methylmalonyl-CoA mutase family protein [Acrocarpospora macrocephala]|uniref:Methylmalonyl-CoA mutase n=1 Tax=Acrocarpospora macrocephala TaxID=150177 RepID=A0A5M3WW28_9ACTN|nr:acyl-CoA mutase large subunit family protein [Acrocarpospora macrocephala]GES11521.1 methylmalonyl-CoA mutase [Acrocarpospora macrocephala]
MTSLTSAKFEAAKRAWAERRARYAAKLRPARTLSGLPLKTVYTPDDTTASDLAEMPGVYPFTRGLHPDGYALTPWMQQMVFGYGTIEETRRKMEKMVAEGMEGYFGHKVFNTVYDVPCMYGIDADHPEAVGNIGQCGVHMSTGDDYDELIRDWDLETTNFSMITGDNCLPALALLAAAVERRGEPVGKMHGNSMNWYPRIAVQDVPSWEPRWGYALMIDLIRWARANAPDWNPANIFMYGLSEAGATPVQELAYGLAWGKSIIDAGLAAGLEPDDFIGRLSFQIGCTVNVFEEVAKFRAHRRMWARLCKDAGVTKPSGMFARVHVHTSGYVLTQQQLMNNNARITLQTLAAVLGGVQSIHTCSYDEAVGVPTEQSHRTALRTQQILMWESGLRDVADPLGGSYFIEKLTDEMEAAAWEIFDEIEASGGYLRGIETGEVKRNIDNSSYEMKKMINSGDLPIVGVNRYVSQEQENYEPFRIDETIEVKARARLEAYRAKRDQAAVDAAIEDVRRACQNLKDGTGPLMPALVDAARKGVTNGEMMVPMREAFGWYVSE